MSLNRPCVTFVLFLRVRNFPLEAQNFHSISGLVIGQSVLREVSLGTISFSSFFDHVTVIASKKSLISYISRHPYPETSNFRFYISF